MTVRRVQALLCALLFVPFTQRLLAQTNHTDSTAAAKRFAQSFYDWYTHFLLPICELSLSTESR
jgi:hypothetical protein